MKYLYKIFLISIIIFMFITPAFADDIEWVDPQEKTLRLMESVTRDGFIIEASDFYDNSALISVYDTSHNLISRNVTRINDWMEINGRLNISIKNVKEKIGNISASLGMNVVVDQWVKIETRVAGRPIPRVSISPVEEKINNKSVVRRSFIPGSEISVNFSVRNEGKAVLKDTILKINSSLPLVVDDKLNYELLDIGKGNGSGFITVRFMVPYEGDKMKYRISAQARGKDILGKTYSATDYIEIDVKRFEKNADIGEERIYIKKYVTEKVYMGDVAVVSLYIKNNGSNKIENMTLKETLSSGLMPVNTNLSWNFSLGPLEEKSISYKIKPERPGSYFFPPGSTRIEYKDGLEFDKKLIKLIVNGPYVVLSKSANIEKPLKGDNVTITIEAKNLGNAVAIAKISDSVPVNYSLESGNISFSQSLKTVVLRPGNSTSFLYIINLKDNGLFILPPVKATVLDQFLNRDDRYTQKISSGNLSIDVKEPVRQQEPVKIIRTPVPTKSPERTNTPVPVGTVATTPESTPGFQGYIFILILFIVNMIFKKKGSIDLKKIFIILSIILVIVFYTGSAYAYERPEFNDGLATTYHPANICVPCHYMLVGTVKAQAISNSCNNCHKYSAAGRKLDMNKIENIHKDIVCIKCHAGSRSGTNITAGDFHRVMSKTACLSCHTYENGTYQKPLKTKCSDCHSESPHVVHGKKLEKMCVACHGEDIGKYINTNPVEAGNKMLIPGQNLTITKMTEYPTIGQFIIKLIEQFTQISR